VERFIAPCHRRRERAPGLVVHLETGNQRGQGWKNHQADEYEGNENVAHGKDSWSRAVGNLLYIFDSARWRAASRFKVGGLLEHTEAGPPFFGTPPISPGPFSFSMEPLCSEVTWKSITKSLIFLNFVGT
jgi:hypothetical protein